MRKKLWSVLLTVLMCVAFCLGVVACDNVALTKLGKVTLTLDGNMAIWEEVENASRYAYVINNEDPVETTLRAVELENGDTIKVKAVGDGIAYSDGNYCAPKKYTATPATTLGTVTITFNGCVATWEPVPNASAYAYKINGGDEETTTARALVLQSGDNIIVKAVGDGVHYRDGVYSEPATYTAPVTPPSTPDPSVPTEYLKVVIGKTIEAGDTLTLADIALPTTDFAWKQPETVVTASGDFAATYTDVNGTVDVQVYIDLTINETAEEPESTPTVPEYTTIVITKTIEEGTNITLADVTGLPTGFAWKTPTTAVTASGYFGATYTDANGTADAQVYLDLTVTSTPVEPEPEPEPDPEVTTPPYTTIVVQHTITEGEELYLSAITSKLPQGFAWLVPDGVVTGSGLYAATYTDENGTASAEVYLDLTITPATITPEKLGNVTLSWSGDMVTWAAVANASRYAYQIGDGEVVETTLRAVQLQDGDTIKVKAVGDGVYYTDGDYCASATYNAPPAVEPTKLGDVTVTLKGHTASWAAVTGASRYAYQINDGEVVETTLREITLNAGDTIKVKAIGDGVTYADGDYCAALKHNTIYDRPINDGPVSATINNLDTAASATVSGADVMTSGVISTVKFNGNAAYYVGYWQTATLTIPMYRNGAPMTEEKLRLYSHLTLSVMVHGDDLYSDAARANAPTVKIGNQTFTPSDWVSGWNEMELSIDNLIASGYTSQIKVEISRPTYYPSPSTGCYMIYFDDLAGVYGEKLDLGNVMVFGDSYSTYEGYIRDPRFYYYADKPVSQTDVNDVSQTWWGQVIANTESNLIMNDSVAGSTVAGYTYGSTNVDGWPPQDTFFERLDSLIANGYFESNDVDTVFMFGGTNDAWGQTAPAFGGGYTVGEPKYSDWTADDLNYVVPAYCYFVSKVLEYTDATVVVVLNTFEEMSRNVYTTSTYDVQGAIINAMKGFAEYGTRIQIVALNNNEYNDPDTSLGDHPTKAGMTAIKDQILNVLYERKYLSQDKWTQVENRPIPERVTLNTFSTWDSNNDPYMLGDAKASVDTTTTADGNGSWAVQPSVAGVASFVICTMNNVSTYESLTLVVYADSAAAADGITLYMDTDMTKVVGTVSAGWNEFTIAGADVVMTTNQWGNTYFAVFFRADDANSVLYFDSLTGVTQ